MILLIWPLTVAFGSTEKAFGVEPTALAFDDVALAVL
jgi:hypothetical protein